MTHITPIHYSISKLYFLSDTHLEHLDREIPIHIPESNSQTQSESNEVIALLGDIGWFEEDSYWNFIQRCASHYDVVFLIIGNHEYYYQDIHKTDAKIKKILHEKYIPNVYFLQNNYIEFKNCIVWGSTLWSRITISAYEMVTDKLVIHDASAPNKKLRMGTIFELHNKALYHLRQVKQYAQNQQKPLIVLTHYAPLLEMNGRFIQSPTGSAYATNLKDIITEPIIAWLCGHTHENITHTVNNIICRANCVGYPGEYLTNPYDPEAFISINQYKANTT